MQVMPEADPQQSEFCVHFSATLEHCPTTGMLHTVGDCGLFGSDGRQKPSQHWSPVVQLWPSGKQGWSAHAARSLRVGDWFGR